MCCDFSPIGQNDVCKEALIAPDQFGTDKRGLKLHEVVLYLDVENDKIEGKMANPTAAMLVIGDEILSGRTKDKNLVFLADKLTEAAIDLREVRIVADEQTDIVDALRALSSRWDNVFTSGGIGPTHDDITADAVAAAFNVSISVRADARALLVDHYKKSGVELNEARLRMARIPDGATLIENPVSVAPGFTLRNVHVMAGVPAIFQTMVGSVLPKLSGGSPLLSRTLRVNLPEGEIAGPLGKIAATHIEVSIGSYPFIQNGKFGSNIVFRCADAKQLDAAVSDFAHVFDTACEQ